MQGKIIRKASHYTTWYYGPEDKLKEELESYLDKAKESDYKDNLRGMIVPHAGIMWSGATAAWGFKNLINSNFKRLFILGPSHFAKFNGCLLSTAIEWETPFGNLTVDRTIMDDLKSKNKEIFFDLPLELDEYEHSLEMQIPYLGLIYKNKDVSIIPIMTGDPLTLDKENEIAKILLPYYLDKDNLFIVSEDFCHWGPRHNFWYHDEKHGGKIHQSIEFLDETAFKSISGQKAKEFKDYLEESKNNLCGGGSPVTIYVSLMEMSNQLNERNIIDFVHYTKSDVFIDDKNEESVSYAVGLNYLK